MNFRDWIENDLSCQKFRPLMSKGFCGNAKITDMDVCDRLSLVGYQDGMVYLQFFSYELSSLLPKMWSGSAQHQGSPISVVRQYDDHLLMYELRQMECISCATPYAKLSHVFLQLLQCGRTGFRCCLW